MRGHQIGHNILLESELLVDLLKLPDEGIVNLHLGLSHLLQHVVGNVLRCHPHLPADMIRTDFPQELLVGIRHEVVKAEAGTHENLLHAGQGTHLPQKLHVVAVIHPEILTG